MNYDSKGTRKPLISIDGELRDRVSNKKDLGVIMDDKLLFFVAANTSRATRVCNYCIRHWSCLNLNINHPFGTSATLTLIDRM